MYSNHCTATCAFLQHCLDQDLIPDLHLLHQLAADPYIDGSEAQLKLQRAILCLPEKQRLVFNMRYFDELKYEDMSEILGTSVGALRASYHHAVKKIEQFMAQD